MRTVLMLAALFGLVAPATAQVLYQPVRFQHGGQNPYFYAGDDALTHRLARGPVDGAGRFGRVDGFAFVAPGDLSRNRVVHAEAPRVYTDAIPHVNAHIYGYTANDVRNEAYARVPTYFRKADLLRASQRLPDGSRVVSPYAGRDVAAAPDRPQTDGLDAVPVLVLPAEPLRRGHSPLKWVDSRLDR